MLKEQIQKMIAAGQTEDALKLLAAHRDDAILLQARYNNGKSQFTRGMMEFGEWSRIQNQVNYAVLEFTDMLPPEGEEEPKTTTKTEEEKISASSPFKSKQKSVFISYNHNDAFAMRSIKSFLEDQDIKVTVDYQDMGLADDIQAFINKAIKENDVVLSIVSQNSLVSGWVGKETSAILLLSKLDAKVWLPLRIDNALFDDQFFEDSNEKLNKKIEELNTKMKRAMDNDNDFAPFYEEKKRLKSHKDQFGQVIADLRAKLVIDISGPFFDIGMDKVAKHIKKKA